MDTPICDFVNQYINSNAVRMHMPGHKGKNLLGMESMDITEIDGADSLFEASGIIHRSEANAGSLFDAHTFYSTEGSSLCIRAMLHIALTCNGSPDGKNVIFAGRNAHKAFLSAAALLDFEVEWLWGSDGEYLSCSIDAGQLEHMLKTCDAKPCAVYITSPDYLGNMADVAGLAKVCHRHGVLLIVDNAHGAYTKFLPKSLHPIDLGADMCCDSAHKTLPVLTGGAYLHVSYNTMESCSGYAKTAMELFASTSPSYIILQSLDEANKYLASGYSDRLGEFVQEIMAIKYRFVSKGLCLVGDEPMKITIKPKAYGYSGKEFACRLRKSGIVCEFADNDYVVLMPTPNMDADELALLCDVVDSIARREPVCEMPPSIPCAEQVMTIRQAVMSQKELLPVQDCSGRVLAISGIGCPPAVPVVVCGERIDNQAIACMQYYGVDKCWVVK